MQETQQKQLRLLRLQAILMAGILVLLLAAGAFLAVQAVRLNAVAQRLAELGKSDCHFCQFRITTNAGAGQAAALESLSAGEMAETKPIDLIERYFDMRKRTLTQEERQMINTAIEMVTENNAK